jgi:hypothetical protein
VLLLLLLLLIAAAKPNAIFLPHLATRKPPLTWQLKMPALLPKHCVPSA